MRQVCIFSGSSHPVLTDSICERLGQKPDKVDLRKFSNGETSVEIRTSVRDHDVFIIQSGSSKTNDNVIELLIMIAACRGGSSRSITAVMPYFPYSRQSKRKSHRGAITARMVANLMNVAGVTHVITIDLHASQSQGFFKCPVDNLVAEPILAKWIRNNVKDWQNAVVVSKNPGGTKRVTSLADALKLSFGIVTTDRRRPNLGASSMMGSALIGSAVLGSMGLDGADDDRASLDDEAEAQPYDPIEHDFGDDHYSGHHGSHAFGYDGQDDDERRLGLAQGKPGTARSAACLGNGLANRLSVNGHNHSSPLKHSSRADSSDSLAYAEEDRGGSGSDDGSSLHRVHTVVSVSHSPELLDSEADGGEYNDERARDVITGRLVHGHLVDDDQPSPHLSVASTSNLALRHRQGSDDDPPEHMMTSFMSTGSSYRPENGLGGTADATASDEEEEENLQDPELETTITLVGNVRKRPVFIVDDIIDKAGSWIAAAETVTKRGGATAVCCMATHGLFGGNALQEMEACDQIDRIVVTNAFPIPEEKRRGVKKLVVLDVSNLLAEAIRRNHHGESISQLFQHYD